METRGIAEGMTVRGDSGEKLGKVIECAADGFVVEKGLFFPKDYSIRYDQVADVRDGEVVLNVKDLDVGTRAPAGEGIAQAHDEIRVPLAAEELEAQKRERQAGEVRVQKEVVTEHRELSVPVTREEVRVERVPAQGDVPAGQAAFQEGTVAVPVREEEVEIRKKPVVKEEVRVGRTRHQEERRADAEVRHEEARIDESGDVKRSAGDGTMEEDLPRPELEDPER